jgi:Gly-Xaa carboxypeptidase
MSQANEKVGELPGVHARISTTKLCKAKAVASKIALVALAVYVSTNFVKRPFSSIPTGNLKEDVTDLCPQVDELVPEKNGAIWENLQDTYSTEEFKARAIDWLGGAVRIPCVVSLVIRMVCIKRSSHAAQKRSMTWEM